MEVSMTMLSNPVPICHIFVHAVLKPADASAGLALVSQDPIRSAILPFAPPVFPPESSAPCTRKLCRSLDRPAEHVHSRPLGTFLAALRSKLLPTSRLNLSIGSRPMYCFSPWRYLVRS